MAKQCGRLSSITPLVYFMAKNMALIIILFMSLLPVKRSRSSARPTVQTMYGGAMCLFLRSKV